jgi:hypothetical protein
MMIYHTMLCMPRREVMRNGMWFIGGRLDQHKGYAGDELRAKDIGKLARGMGRG